MIPTRRDALVSAAGLVLAGPALAAGALRPTPAQTEGPFYPDVMPPETDPDLVQIGRRQAKGEVLDRYAFRTIRPAPYPGRTPHIHYKIFRPDGRVLTTRMLVDGEPGNARDGVFRRLAAADRDLVVARLARAPNGWRTQWDIVLV